MRVGRAILLTGVLALSPLAVAPTLATTPAKTADPGKAAAGWLAAQVHAGGLTPSSLADAIIAFAATGVGADAAATALTQLEGNVDSYILNGATLQAGATGKVMLAVHAAGGDVHAFGGHNLETELRGILADAGADAGHFGSGQIYDQSLDILALATTATGVPEAAATWLVSKQCTDGDFSYDGTCPSPFGPDPDSTAIAIQALQAAGETTALGKAETWLLAQQGPDGALSTFGIANSTSSAATAEAYRALGHVAEADKAAAFALSLQLGCDAAAANVGAIPWQAGVPTYLMLSTPAAVLGGGGRLDQLSLTGATATAPTLACPGAPTGVTAVAGPGEAAVSWTAPADGPSPITSYLVQATPGTGTCAPKPATATSCTVRDLPDGKYTFSVVAVNDLGISRASAASNKVAIDTTAPVVKAPAVGLRVGLRLTGTNVPVRVSWSGTDAVSGISAFTLGRSADGGTTYNPVTLGSSTATSKTTTLAAGPTIHRFRVGATDASGNTSAWKAGPALTVSLVDDAAVKVTYKGTWTTSTPAAASGATLHSTKVRGASASITFTGRGIAWVAPKGTNRGKAALFLDGTRVGTVNLDAASASRVLVYAKSWAASGKHTLRIVAVGTAGHPRIDVDAFAIVK